MAILRIWDEDSQSYKEVAALVGPKGDKGDTGAPGPAGADGQDGQAATIQVGATTTGEPGTNATVTNSGTSSAAVFDFVVPRGAQGPAGADGAQGPAGPAGPNEVGVATATSFNGLLKGNGSTVAQAVAGEDYEAAGTAASTIATHNTADDAHSELFAEKADISHNQAASTITAGTLAGATKANATAVATLADAQVRNIYAGTTDLTAGTSTLATGDIYFVYE